MTRNLHFDRISEFADDLSFRKELFCDCLHYFIITGYRREYARIYTRVPDGASSHSQAARCIADVLNTGFLSVFKKYPKTNNNYIIEKETVRNSTK